MIMLCIVSREGRLARWETGGEKPRLTHAYEHGSPCLFTAEAIETMREGPPSLRVATEEPNIPTPTPPNAAAARAA